MIVLTLSFYYVHFSLAQENKEAEGVYTIKPGDTLWDISSKFLKNPFLWPKLWQRNPYIGNPHWIYPGNPIRLSTMTEIKKEEPKKEVVEKKSTEELKEAKEVKEANEVKEVKEVRKAEPLPIEKKPEVVVEAKPVEEKPPVFSGVRSAGFLSDIDYKGIGIILANKEGKTLMAEGDILHLAFKTSEPILIGNKYTVIRASEIIRHPLTGKKESRKYNITGNIQIIDQHGNFYVGKVVEAFDAILVGDLIWPYSKEKMDVQGSK
jgi:hypothetical protein